MSEFVVMGKVVGSHGIKGWLKIQPFSEEINALCSHPVWFLSKDEIEWDELKVQESSMQGRTVLAKIENTNDRNEADRLRGYLIGIKKNDLPILEKGKYYWSDLIGLEVFNQEKFNFERGIEAPTFLGFQPGNPVVGSSSGSGLLDPTR